VISSQSVNRRQAHMMVQAVKGRINVMNPTIYSAKPRDKDSAALY